MKQALKTLKDESKKSAALRSTLQSKIAQYRHRFDLAKAAADATRNFEKAKHDLGLARNSKLSVSERVGMKLSDKSASLSVNEIVAKWDDSGDGTIGKEEFRNHVAKLIGVKQREPETASGGEIDQLFDSLDKVCIY